MTPPFNRPWGIALVTGTAVFIFQLLWIYACLPQTQGFLSTFLHLFQWDSFHYAHITEYGYRGVPSYESSAAFSPGYPVVSGAIKKLLDLNTRQSLFFASFLGTWVFWCAFSYYLTKLRIGLAIRFAVLWFCVSHPAAYFMLSAYSESWLLCSLLIFLLACTTFPLSRLKLFIGGIAGFIMTATRLVGLPVVLAPFIWLACHQHRLKATLLSAPFAWLRSYAWLFVATVSGSGVFFLYCHVVLGQWDLYFFRQTFQWSIAVDYLSPLQPLVYQSFLPDNLVALYDQDLEPTLLNYATVWFITVVFIGFLLFEWIQYQRYRYCGFRERAPLYYTAWMMYYIPLCGVAHLAGLQSLHRYGMVSIFLLALIAASLLKRVHKKNLCYYMGLFIFFLLGNIFFLIQYAMLQRFSHGLWVA